MPIKETDLQTELKDATIAAGGYAYKMSNRFLVGVLDLFEQMPGMPTITLEVKYIRKFPKDGMVAVELTPHQIRTINNTNKAGGNAGWIVIVRRGPGEYAWHAGRNPPEGKVHATPFGCASVKLRGKPWPIKSILDEVTLK